MSSSEAVLSVGVAYTDFLERARRQVTTLPLRRDAALVPPAAAGAVRLYAPDRTLLIDDTFTIVGNVATYQVEAAQLPATLAYGRGYSWEWDIEAPAGVTRTYVRDASLCRVAVRPTVSDLDVTKASRALARQLATGTTYQDYIDEAWETILSRLEGLGVFTSRIVEGWVLKACHLALTKHLICLDLSLGQQGEKWAAAAEDYGRSYELEFGRLKFSAAPLDEEGMEDPASRSQGRKGVTHMNASPPARWPGRWGI